MFPLIAYPTGTGESRMKFKHSSTELSGCRFSRADISRSSETSEEVQAIESGHPLFLGSRKVGGPFRSLSRGKRGRSGARECLLTRPGHESGVRDSRARPAVLVLWLMRSWRGILLKKISTRGRSLQLQAAPDRSYRDRASTSGSRLKPLRRRFRTTENTENTEKENTRDAVKAEEEITHGDRQDQELATRGSRLRAATLGSRPSLLVSGLSDSTGKLSGASSQARRTLTATS